MMRRSYVAWRRSPLHHLTLGVIKVWTAIAEVHHPPAYALILHSEFLTISLQIWHSPDLYEACLVLLALALLPPASSLSIRIFLGTVSASYPGAHRGFRMPSFQQSVIVFGFTGRLVLP